MKSSPRREKADDVINVQNIEGEARKALVRGDRTAVVKILMDGYGDRIYRYCRNLLADANDAGEASQQVFLLAFEYMDTFEGMKHFLPWLRGIATRHCADVLKNNVDRNGLFVVGNHLPDDADLRPSGEELLTHQWLISEVELCLDELPSQDRLMLTLRFIEELTYVEMGELVGMPVSTVKLRVSSAMAALRRSLAVKEIRP
jgi:RNA polymerase sigma-70 factor (ECF subfamily)